MALSAALSAAFNEPVHGVNLSKQTLGEELGQRITLVVFLRHLGCIFCREMVKDIRKAAEANAGYPPVLFFYQGDVADGRTFFRDYYPTARAVADLQRKFYDAAGMQQASTSQLLSPRLMLCALRATAKGNMQRLGRVIGDPWTMPGVMLMQRDRVLWQHEFLHAGDHPDFKRIPELVRNASSLAGSPNTSPAVS